MKKLILLTACLASATALADNNKKYFTTPSELAWAQPFRPKGPTLGFVEGKFGDGHPASFFLKVQAGFEPGWHIHSEDYPSVVISRTFAEQQQRAAENALPPGSYF